MYQRWLKTDQKTKCLILESFDNVLQQQDMSIATTYDILFKFPRII